VSWINKIKEHFSETNADEICTILQLRLSMLFSLLNAGPWNACLFCI